MLKHIIMFKIKESANKSEHLKNIEIVKEKLENLKSHIPEIKKLEVGINVVEVAWAFDLVLTIDFENLAAFEIYKTHPAHQAFIEFNKQFSVAKAAVDYII
ncbi:MAG: Dabb family protein [Bacteroidia bacterium]|nr:Dabb family protein [Bacteroidia bacterium]